MRKETVRDLLILLVFAILVNLWSFVDAEGAAATAIAGLVACYFFGFRDADEKSE